MRSLLLGLVLLGSSSCHSAAAQAWVGSVLEAPTHAPDPPDTMDPFGDPFGDPIPPGCVVIRGIIFCR